MSGSNAPSGWGTGASPSSSAPNPLASGQQNVTPPKAMSAPGSHMQAGAQIANMGLPASEIVKQAAIATYAANEFAKMARDPDLTGKDVVRAASQAVADKMTTPEGAIKLLSSMPTDRTKLHAWARALYGANLVAAIHLKAMAQQGGFAVPSMKKRGGRRV